MASMLHMAGLEVYAHFLVTVNSISLACGFFHRSKTKVRGVAANFGKKSGKFRYNSFSTVSEKGYTGIFSPINMGRDRFTYCLCTNKEIGERYLVTTAEDLEKDFYEFLMQNYKLPLKREWIPTLRKLLLDEDYVDEPRVVIRTDDSKDIEVMLNGKERNLFDLICYDFRELNEEKFEKIVSSALATKQIFITEHDIASLEFEGMDGYFNKYGCKVVDNLDKDLNPLVELKPNVENLALKVKSLFPQQAASIEGVLAMEKQGIHYAVLNHGMGCGKTIEAASVIEASMVGKWLKRHPKKTLRDAYERDGIITYRAIIMAPGHLVAKWAQEVEEEIPYAKATIITQLSQLIELRETGRKPRGKEFFVISKDTCKLDTQQSPIPTQIKKKYIALSICKDCAEEEQKIVYKKGLGSEAHCPDCNGRNFMPYPLKYLSRKRGLICPSCGELLMEYKNYNPDAEDFDENVVKAVLTPCSFAKSRTGNSCCYHCGTPLWGSNAKPIVSDFVTPREPKWYKVSHFANHRKKSKATAFVLRGRERDYYDTCITIEGLSKSSQIYGPRKVAPARFVKKYLKGYFDFCVLDEAHKYLGNSAQSVAAHTLIKASKFTLALTGTISNGTAASFYNLFWMLEPSRMINMGYSYSNSEMMRFCKEFGCVETTYEEPSNADRLRNANSRGKQISTPRIKPGISPVLFGKLLMDRCLFLDISDLSKYLPKLKERVILVELPWEIAGAYHHTLDILKDASKKEYGMAALSSMLQFGLSYPDKPYGREPIKSPYNKDVLICNVANHDEFAGDTLTPKEEKLVELVNKEMEESRNVFIYATFTGSAESNVCYRLQDIIEKHCNLEGRVEIIHSTSPEASKREAFFHERASQGIKVFITNPMNVETGLDFCFKHKGKVYNYPTLIFYQTSYSLATIWQASRRAYRLNQKEECRVFYLAYEDTLQAAAIDIMARKQVATAAIQGHFSAEGLSSMARGVDARTQLAQALSNGDMSNRESLENMFDALEAMNEGSEEDAAYSGFKPSLTFYELLGLEPGKEPVNIFEQMPSTQTATTFGFGFDSFFNTGVSSLTDVFTETGTVAVAASVTEKVEVATEPVSMLDDLVAFFAGFGTNISQTNTFVTPVPAKKEKARKAKVVEQGVQHLSLFDFA